MCLCVVGVCRDARVVRTEPMTTRRTPDPRLRGYCSDAFDPNLSADENHAAVQVVLANSFESFISQLSGDPNLELDEGPEG